MLISVVFRSSRLRNSCLILESSTHHLMLIVTHFQTFHSKSNPMSQFIVLTQILMWRQIPLWWRSSLNLNGILVMIPFVIHMPALWTECQVVPSWNKFSQWHFGPNYCLRCRSTWLSILHPCLFRFYYEGYSTAPLMGQIGHNHNGSYWLQQIPPEHKGTMSMKVWGRIDAIKRPIWLVERSYAIPA